VNDEESNAASCTSGGKDRIAELSAPPTRMTGGPSPDRSNAMGVPSLERTVPTVPVSSVMAISLLQLDSNNESSDQQHDS
jgi:hypothetical protein